MSRKAEPAIVAQAKQSIESDVMENPYESPRAVADPDEVAGPNRASKPTPEQRRRWRRAVIPCILFSLAAGFSASFNGDLGAFPLAAWATPAIVAYWLILASTGRRRLAGAVFALWLAAWLAPCGYIWLRYHPVQRDHPIDVFALEAALILVVSHAAAYGGIRIGMRS